MRKTNTITIVALALVAFGIVFSVRLGPRDTFDQVEQARRVYADNFSPLEPDSELTVDQLRHAIRSGNEERLLQLLSLQSLSNNPDTAKSHPLIPLAIGVNRLVIARHLIDAGYDIHAKDRNHTTSLHIAALHGFADAAAFLLDRGFDQLDATDDGGRTALRLAVENEFLEVAELLLAKGVDPNVRDQRGRGPIYFAVKRNQEEMTKVLLDYGANGSSHFNGGASLLETALEKGNIRIAQLLVEAGTPIDEVGARAVHTAVLSSRLGVISFLAKTGADLSVPDKKGDSVLVHAVSGGRPVAIKALLSAGVDPDTVDHYGRSVLGRASACAECMEALIDSGANVNYGGKSVAEYEDFAVKTPLIWAVLSARNDAVEQLLKAGADVRLPDSKEGRPPIVHAARIGGRADMIRLLIEHGADPNSKDAGHWPALVQSVAFSDNSTIAALIDAGADVNEANWHGWTPLMAATANGDIAVASMLLSKGAAINARTRKGWTALSEAHHYGHFDLSAMLEAAGAVDPINPPMRASKDRGKLEISVTVHD